MRLVLFARVPGWYSFRGDRMVTRFTQEGHQVVGIVVQRSSTLVSLREWRQKLGVGVVFRKCLHRALSLLCLGGLRKGQSVSASRFSPPVYVVDSHTSPSCAQIVRSLAPEVLILRGCGIIKKNILDIPKRATLNAHYATLPAYRGMDVTEWAVLHGDPVAVSVHEVSEGIDTGRVLAFRHIPIAPGDNLGLLREKSAAMAVELFAEVLAALQSGSVMPGVAQGTEGRQFFVMHPRLRSLANERLQDVTHHD